MYGLDENFPKQLLIGKHFVQVCFGENDLIFNCSDGSSILIMSAIVIDEDVIENFKSISQTLIDGCLGRSICSAKVVNRSILSISMSSGFDFSIVDNSVLYESFVFSTGEQKFAV